jgi:choline monooxygenase
VPTQPRRLSPPCPTCASLPEALAPAQSPLPVGSYFDPGLYEREVDRLFARSPRYVGHSLAVPEVGDYFALPHENEGRVS